MGLAKNEPVVRGLVSSVHPLASQAGVEILRKGGNAVDAAVTTALTMHVVAPAWSTIGGGAFILIYRRTAGQTVAIDAREVAPKKASTSPAVFTIGYQSIGVPGCLSGYHLALEQYGTIGLKQALEPAIKYAREGYEISRRMHDILRDNIDGALDKARKFPATSEMLLQDGYPPSIGDRIVSADLARTLQKIADSGPGVFYHGEIAEAIARDMAKNGGFLTKEDLSEYKPRVREPVTGTYRGYEICSAPPPSGGGGAIIEALNILESFDLAGLGHNTASSIHVIAESLKRAYLDNDNLVADPDFIIVPTNKLTAKDYAREMSRQIDLGRASARVSPYQNEGFNSRVPPHQSGRSDFSKRGNTAHLVAVDRERNMVSITDSINYYFGSGVVIENTGILMNDTMRDFRQEDGKINSIEAGKRPKSWMSPTLVMVDGKAFLAVGSAGGPKIVSGVLQVLINVIDFKMNIAEAVQAPRFHCQGNEISVAPTIPRKVREELREKGHLIKERGEWWFFGAVQAALVDPKTNEIHGVADPLRDGVAIKE